MNVAMLQRTMLHGNAETLLLYLLGKTSSHGYRLRQELVRYSRQYLQISVGRLYPLLQDMQARGLVTSVIVHERGRQEQRRYTITRQGRSDLQQRLIHWRKFQQSMDSVLSS